MRPSKELPSILFIGTQMERAGAQRMLLSQARWFYSRGYRVYAAFFYDKQGLVNIWKAENPFPVIAFNAWKKGTFLPLNAFRLVPGLIRLFRFLKKEKFQITVTFTPHSNILGLLAAWVAGVPVRVATHHGYIEASTPVLAFLHGWLINHGMANVLVAVSSQVRSFAILREKVRPEQIVVIENGIEPLGKGSLTPAERISLRDDIGVSKDGVLLLTVGRLTIQKGHTVLLDAIAALAPKFPLALFAFAGDGLQRPTLEQKARRLGIQRQVRFLGVRDDVDELLLAADIFVQPSLWEGLSLAMLEALWAGLPVLATQVEGVVDVIADGRDGLLVPADDPQALTEAIAKLLNDAPLRARLAKQGKHRAETAYSIEKMCEKYESLFQELIGATSA